MQSRTRTMTVVFTDMAGYTRTSFDKDRRGLRDLLATHQRLVEPVLTNLGGRIVKNIGDSFMAVFDNATDAIRACLDLIEAHPPGSDASVLFRASAATGDVEEIASDVFGDMVNLASRINSAASEGEVWFSHSTLLCMKQAEIPWESVGLRTLKGIPGEVEIFRAVPRHRAWLPEALVRASRQREVVVWSAGDPVPPVNANSHMLLDGFRPGSPMLATALGSLPVVDPGRIWLCAYNISPSDRTEWLRSGRGLVIGYPAAVRAAILQCAEPPKAGTETIILDLVSDSLVLMLAGLALPAVPHAEVVAGYTYDLQADGRWVNYQDRPVLRVEVSSAGVTLTALAPGVQVNGMVASVPSSWGLEHGTTIQAAGLIFRFIAVHQEGYLGVLVGDTPMRIGVQNGQTVELGREPQGHGLILPDRNTQDNIRWCSGQRAARLRERGFTLDKVLTGRRQASVSIDGGEIEVKSIHESCPTLLLNSEGQMTRINYNEATDARMGDMLILGTSVVKFLGP